MEVTLRKASALSKALLEAAKKLPAPRSVEVSIYAEGDLSEVIAAEVQEGLAKLVDNTNNAQRLFIAGFSIREKIGAANAYSGINALLSERAVLDAREKLLAPLVEGAAFGTKSDIAAAKLETLRARASAADARNYGLTEELTVSLGDGADFVEFANDLLLIRRRKTSLADDLLALNTTTKITLSAGTVELLNKFKLI